MKYINWKCLFLVIICISIVALVLLMHISEHFMESNYCNDNLNYIQQQSSFRNKVEARFQKAFSEAKEILNLGTDVSERKSWFQVSNHIFVYSAYADSCGSIAQSLSPYCVKFVGAVLSNLSDFDASLSPINCAFKYDHGHIVKNGFAVIKKVPEAHDEIYSAALLFCFVFQENQWPNYVTLFESTQKDFIWLPLHIVSPNIGISPPNISIAVCVRPLYGSISVVNLSEFLSYYSVIGVDHFIFYQYQLLGAAENFLKIMKFANISVEILPWDIPLIHGIHELGQLVFSQECIAHTRFLFSHVAIIDLDEFIVLKRHENVKTFLKDMDERYNEAGSYVISMSLFCEEYYVTSHQFPPLNIFIRNRRQKSVWKPGFRSKYIAKPDKVQMAGVHYVWSYEFDHKEIVLPNYLVLLHHYRACCGIQQTWFFHLFSFYVLSDKSIEDNSLSRFKDSVTNHSVIKFLLSPSEYLLPRR